MLPQNPTHEELLALHLFVAFLILGIGIAVGWVLHRVLPIPPKVHKVKEITNGEIVLEEWEIQDGYHQYKQFRKQ